MYLEQSLSVDIVHRVLELGQMFDLPSLSDAAQRFAVSNFEALRTSAVFMSEVGVEHLLRDINDPSVSSLANQVT